MTINDNKSIIKIEKGGVQMNEKYEYWVQDQRTGITLRYYPDQLEQAIEAAGEMFNEGAKSISIWKMFPKENRSIELTTFFHKEE